MEGEKGLEGLNAPVKINTTPPPVISEDSESRLQKNEGSLDDIAEKTIKDKYWQLKLKRFEQETTQRKSFADKNFGLVVGWAAMILAILFLQGFKAWDFELSEGVILALIGATTANILSFYGIVTRHIFPRPKNDPEDKSTEASKS